MDVSKASVEIWKGMVQLEPRKIGAMENISFEVSNAV
jgi:hypothetical protein